MSNDQSSCGHDPSTAREICDIIKVPHSPEKQQHGRRMKRLSYTKAKPFIQEAAKFVGKLVTRESIRLLFDWLTQFI